ncbi:MAG: hypothetical protein ACLP7A_06415 [Desulfobaccales bacterium]
MDKLEALSGLKEFVIEHRLPKIEIALFGIKCPYCGKSDRILQLETPDELNGDLAEPDLERYTSLWTSLVEGDVELGLCKFCLNPLKLDLNESRAERLFV